MTYLRSFHIALACASLFLLLPGCGRPAPEAHAVVVKERKEWEPQGWEYVATVGVPRRTPVEAREVRHSDATGKLVVIAPGERLPGSEQLEDMNRTFQEAGWQFLEVKLMAGESDGYSVVFRKRKE